MQTQRRGSTARVDRLPVQGHHIDCAAGRTHGTGRDRRAAIARRIRLRSKHHEHRVARKLDHVAAVGQADLDDLVEEGVDDAVQPLASLLPALAPKALRERREAGDICEQHGALEVVVPRVDLDLRGHIDKHGVADVPRDDVEG